MLERLPETMKADISDISSDFKNGLGILFTIKTDTLNKDELRPVDTSIKVYDINPITGKQEPIKTSRSEEELISIDQPVLLPFGNKYDGDTLKIACGISLFSGFAVIVDFINDSTKAFTQNMKPSEKFSKHY
ncbi:MAG: hypothetical protein JO072_09045 [Parafilimonas sp.]|nr:hypothetical protein [Parafilimonas sp.]